ncbi:MAG: hypothetical protein KF904_15175 [Rhodoblastus sp.]|nr:hypothetical protein [Rhodoblastus sp.]
MNGNVNINLAKKTMEITATVASIEDAGAAIDALKAGARALWPAIVFEGEPGFAEAVADAEDEGAAETGSEPRKALPKPGGGMSPAGEKPLTSFAQAVLEGLRAGKTAIEIADEHDVKTQAVGAVVGKLRKRGLIA